MGWPSPINLLPRKTCLAPVGDAGSKNYRLSADLYYHPTLQGLARTPCFVLVLKFSSNLLSALFRILVFLLDLPFLVSASCACIVICFERGCTKPLGRQLRNVMDGQIQKQIGSILHTLTQEQGCELVPSCAHLPASKPMLRLLTQQKLVRTASAPPSGLAYMPSLAGRWPLGSTGMLAGLEHPGRAAWLSALRIRNRTSIDKEA